MGRYALFLGIFAFVGLPPAVAKQPVEPVLPELQSVASGWYSIGDSQQPVEPVLQALQTPASPPLPGVAAPPTPAEPSPSLAPVPDATSPPSVCYVPGEGLTVSMLNNTSTLKLFANFSAIAGFSTTREFPTGGPLFLLPASNIGAHTNTFDLAARQSSFGGSFSGPEFGGFTPGGFFLAYIQNDNLTSDAYGLLPFQAYGDLKSEHWRFAAGLQSDVFNPVSPTMIPLIGLFDSGNSGSFRGQIRLEHLFKPSDEFQLTTIVALSKPTATVVTGSNSINSRITESNGWPNIEGRIAAGIGEEDELAGGRKWRPVTWGVSGLIGQLRNASIALNPDPNDPFFRRATINVWGLGTDLTAAITSRLGVRGELFLGQSLGEYNAMIGQTFGSNRQAIRGAGGFGEVFYYFTDSLHVHTGYGIDAPVIRDLAADQIARNQTFYANAFWDITKAFQVSFEVQYRKTDYVTFKDARGAVFMTQFLWRF